MNLVDNSYFWGGATSDQTNFHHTSLEFDIKITAGCSPAARLYCNLQVHHFLANPESDSSHHSMHLQWGLGGKPAGEGKNDAV